jgi:hypothetical protein
MKREGGVYWRVPESEQLEALSGDDLALQVLRGE